MNALPPRAPGAPPALIAHGGGNGPALARRALADGADCLEVDLWVRRGRFEARHERHLPGPLPVLYERWYLRRAPRPVYRLEDLLLACHGRAGVFLDLKNAPGAAPGLVRRALAGAGGRDARVAASSTNWPLLRAVKAARPDLALYYSVDTPAQFDLFRSVAERDPLPAGVSCRHSLLSERAIARFHEDGLAVVAWTVDGAERARALARWGVDAITTNRAAALRAALADPA